MFIRLNNKLIRKSDIKSVNYSSGQSQDHKITMHMINGEWEREREWFDSEEEMLLRFEEIEKELTNK